MKLKEIIVEEPVGTLSRTMSKIASIVPGKTGMMAKGQLDVAHMANDLYKGYYQYIGSTNQKVSANSLRRFLQNKNIPDNIINRNIPRLTPEDLTNWSQLKKQQNIVPVKSLGPDSTGGDKMELPKQAQILTPSDIRLQNSPLKRSSMPVSEARMRLSDRQVSKILLNVARDLHNIPPTPATPPPAPQTGQQTLADLTKLLPNINVGAVYTILYFLKNKKPLSSSQKQFLANFAKDLQALGPERYAQAMLIINNARL